MQANLSNTDLGSFANGTTYQILSMKAIRNKLQSSTLRTVAARTHYAAFTF